MAQRRSSPSVMAVAARKPDEEKGGPYRQSILNHLTFGLSKDMYSATSQGQVQRRRPLGEGGHDQELDQHPAAVLPGGREARLLPLPGIPPRPAPQFVPDQPRPCRAVPRGCRRPGHLIGGGAGARVGRRPRQRRPGKARRLLPRFHGHLAIPLLRVRHTIRIRHILPEDHGRLADRSAGQLAPVRQFLGIPPGRAPLSRPLLRPGSRPTAARAAGTRSAWTETDEILAMAYDYPVPGIQK